MHPFRSHDGEFAVIIRLKLQPERLSDMDRKYDVRSDVWSLGITLVGITPFHD